MELTKKGAFIKQISIYLAGGGHRPAYELSLEFVKKFPDEMMSHFLAAKSAFWLGKYAETAGEGRLAFNLAAQARERAACAIMAASGYYEMGEYRKGYELLMEIEREGTAGEELEGLLFIFSIAIKDDREALRHVDMLRKLNKKAAENLIAMVLVEK
jgi:hypothetical protein